MEKELVSTERVSWLYDQSSYTDYVKKRYHEIIKGYFETRFCIIENSVKSDEYQRGNFDNLCNIRETLQPFTQSEIVKIKKDFFNSIFWDYRFGENYRRCIKPAIKGKEEEYIKLSVMDSISPVNTKVNRSLVKGENGMILDGSVPIVSLDDTLFCIMRNTIRALLLDETNKRDIKGLQNDRLY